MLVKGKFVGGVVEGFEVSAKPVREAGVNALHRLVDELSIGRSLQCGREAIWGGAAAAGLGGDDECDALIHRGGEDRGLAIARVADEGDALCVDVRVGDEVVDHA